MRRFVDLHTHTIASDGSLAPRELVRLADAKKLAAIAITDHDTCDGIAEAKAAAMKFTKLRLVSGVEVSAMFPKGTLHLLGLGIDEKNSRLGGLLKNLCDARNHRNPKIIALLQSLGCDINMDDVLAVAGSGKIVGRLHIAEALRRKGCVRSTKEAFDRYVGKGAPAFVDKERLSPADAIAAIRSAGGVAVLAHPPQLNYDNSAQLERILRELIRHGLDGIEVYHNDNSPQQTRLYLDMAKRFSLSVAGGSDFHGSAKTDVLLGRPKVPIVAITGRLAELVSDHP